MDAKVTRMMRDSDKVTFTFTGSHPSRGPFRMIYKNFEFYKRPQKNEEGDYFLPICYQVVVMIQVRVKVNACVPHDHP